MVFRPFGPLWWNWRIALDGTGLRLGSNYCNTTITFDTTTNHINTTNYQLRIPGHRDGDSKGIMIAVPK